MFIISKKVTTKEEQWIEKNYEFQYESELEAQDDCDKKNDENVLEECYYYVEFERDPLETLEEVDEMFGFYGDQNA